MQIYLARNNEQAGPYGLEQVNQMLANGQVVLTDLAWHEGMTEWKKLGELTGGQLVYQPVTPVLVTPAPFGQQANPESVRTGFNPKAQVIKGAVAGSVTDLAPISKRVLAKIIDIFLLWIPASIIFSQFVSQTFITKYQNIASQSAIPTPEQQEQLMALLATVPSGAYTAIAVYVLGYFVLQAFLLYRFGQSIGKKALGIMIVDDKTGQKTDITRSFLLRSVVFIILNYFLVLIILVDFGFLFTDRNRTLHDRLARTLVINAPRKT